MDKNEPVTTTTKLFVESELVRKIEELEASHANLKQQISNLLLSNDNNNNNNINVNNPLRRENRSQSMSPRRRRPPASVLRAGSDSFGQLRRKMGLSKMSGNQYLNVLQSMGQSVHIFDLHGRIIYWLLSRTKWRCARTFDAFFYPMYRSVLCF